MHEFISYKSQKRKKIYKSSKKRLIRKGNFLVFIQKHPIIFQGAGSILLLFSPILPTCSSLNMATGTQINTPCRWVGVFLQVFALVFSGQTQSDMERNGPLASTALFKLVLMQISDLVPLCKFTKLLQEHLVLISWHSLHGSACDQQWYIPRWWQITTSQHLSLQEPFQQNLP